MKKLIPLAVLTISIFLYSFHSPKVSHLLIHENRNKNIIDSLDATLYALYLEKSEKDKFLAYLQGLNINQKIVFQFFYKKNGTLTLAIDTGAIGDGSFDKTLDFKLQVYHSCSKIGLDTLNVGVYLGNLEINQKQDLKKLTSIVTNNKIIVFMPYLYPDADGKNAIEYVVCTCGSEAEICTSDQFNYTRDGKGVTGVSANPSPPHGGN
jgi:hypothetical protein